MNRPNAYRKSLQIYQLNAHIYLYDNVRIYHIPPACFGVQYTIFREGLVAYTSYTYGFEQKY